MAKEKKEIFKKDAKFVVSKLNFSEKEIVAKIIEIKKLQEEILDRKKIDEQKLKLVVQL